MDSQRIKPVLIGAFLGTLSVLFGISWAIYLVVNHDGIHERFEADMLAVQTAEQAAESVGRSEHGALREEVHADGKRHMHKSAEVSTDGAKPETHRMEGMAAPAHHMQDPTGEAHKRLARGHAHWMGLGILAVCFSLMLAFLDAPPRVKTLGSACVGIGALVYPISWIFMGYRTITLGIEGAQEAALPFVALSVPLVLLGLIICLFYLIRQAFR
ncbi:MAG: hypothetical protein HY887_02195 [Deltaproteobacteria bacterium]|nr:hypothetical protein [Deltaproteobacteria bacterium]